LQQQLKHLASLSTNSVSGTTAMVVARIIIKNMDDMKTIQTIRLPTHINCLQLTKDLAIFWLAVKIEN